MVLIKGQVRDVSGQPVPEVTISVRDLPELGRVHPREDGQFQFLVNGGQRLLIDIQGPDRIPVQRQISVGWQEVHELAPVRLIARDIASTPADLTGENNEWQVIRASAVADCEGCPLRRSTLLIPPSVRGQVFRDGAWQVVEGAGTIQLTEFTVGVEGPRQMPGPLPANSDYTFAVDLHFEPSGEKIAGRDLLFVDEEGLPDLAFFYVEEFLGMAPGTIVPSAYYDDESGRWIPMAEGHVIEVVAHEGDLAEIDDGNQPPTPPLSDGERAQLVAIYPPGTRLTRVPIKHFSNHDYNYGSAPHPDSESPDESPAAPEDDCGLGQSDTTPGSVIDCWQRVLHEEIPIAGTPFHLHYSSDRVQSSGANNSLSVPLTTQLSPSAEDALLAVVLEVRVLDWRYQKRFDCALTSCANLVEKVRWDGRSYGRRVKGSQVAEVKIKYEYPSYYLLPAPRERRDYPWAFGYIGNRIITQVLARNPTIFTQSYDTFIGGRDASIEGLGGWTFSHLHRYEDINRKLYLGSGGTITGRDKKIVISTFTGSAGGGLQDTENLSEAQFNRPYGISIGADGHLYIGDHNNHRIRQISPLGEVSTVAGGGEGCAAETNEIGDGCLATEATLSYPLGARKTSDGQLYISDWYHNRIRRVDLEGRISTFAGGGSGCNNGNSIGDGCFASEARLNRPAVFVFGADGSVYIADTNHHRIRRIDPNGRISTFAGTGQAGFAGDGGLAINARLNFPAGLAFDPQGNLYLTDVLNHRIRKINPQGIISTIAGNGGVGVARPQSSAIDSPLKFPGDIRVDSHGHVYFADGSIITEVDATSNHCIRRIRQGLLETIAGRCGLPARAACERNGACQSDGQRPTRARFNHIAGFTLHPDGSLLIADHFNHRIRIVDKSQLDPDILIPGEAARSLYRFSLGGTHRSTLDPHMGVPVWQFHYWDDQTLPANHHCNTPGPLQRSRTLCQVVDRNGRVTQVTRIDPNRVTITSPRGQVTTLILNEDERLTEVIDPLGAQWSMTYSAPEASEDEVAEFLASFRRPTGDESFFRYDIQGRLVEDENPAGGGSTF